MDNKPTIKDKNLNDILDEKEVKEDKAKDKKLFLSKLFIKQKKKENLMKMRKLIVYLKS